GTGFLSGRVWDPNTERYGILAETWGTLYTSLLALALGSVLGIAAAIFLIEGYIGEAAFSMLRRFLTPPHAIWGRVTARVGRLLRTMIGRLAAIPGVVYGLWGLFVVIPLIRPLCTWLHMKLGWVPFFATDLSGPGVLPAVIVLAIMILPTVTAISRDALVALPPQLRVAPHRPGAAAPGAR